MMLDEWDEKVEDSSSTPDDGGGGAEATPMEQEEVTEEKEETEAVIEETPKEKCIKDKRKDHLNILFIGHVGS